MRALITGGSGFVGSHLVDELRYRGYSAFVTGRATQKDPTDVTIDFRSVDSILAAIQRSKCDVIFHLAAQAFVPIATAAPLETYEINVMGTARLIEALRLVQLEKAPRLIFVSSAEAYGQRTVSEMPLREDFRIVPRTIYAASKAAAEAIVLASAATYGFEVIVTRAFNHVGPGQNERFAVPAFARRLARAVNNGLRTIAVGNLEAKRDFLDVRDVVKAYVDLAERGVSGEIYNVCSGIPRSMDEILRLLIAIAGVDVAVFNDPELMRPVDMPLMIGDNAKLTNAVGWMPAYDLKETLREVYESIRNTASL